MGGGGLPPPPVVLGSCTGSDTQPNAILSMEATLYERYDETRYIEVYWNAGGCLGYNEDPDYIVTSCNLTVKSMVSWPVITPPGGDPGYPDPIVHEIDGCMASNTDVFEVIPADYYIIEVTLNVGCWFVFKLIVPGYDSDSASCSCMID